MQRAKKWMKCSIRSWIFPGSMLGSLHPKLPNSRSRACCKKLRRGLIRQREKKACVYALGEVTPGCGATPCCSNAYCSLWYPMLCAIHCGAGSSSDVVAAVKCCVSKYGIAVPAFHTSIRNISRLEEHTSELQSRRDIVCSLLVEKKKVYI